MLAHKSFSHLEIVSHTTICREKALHLTSVSFQIHMLQPPLKSFLNEQCDGAALISELRAQGLEGAKPFFQH